MKKGQPLAIHEELPPFDFRFYFTRYDVCCQALGEVGSVLYLAFKLGHYRNVLWITASKSLR